MKGCYLIGGTTKELYFKAYGDLVYGESLVAKSFSYLSSLRPEKKKMWDSCCKLNTNIWPLQHLYMILSDETLL
jgi:hypothetical protein